MNLKSKIFGFAAASVFALTMTTGVMANDSVTGVATLNPRAACTVELTASGDFGYWEYRGDKQYSVMGNSTLTVNADLDARVPGGNCDASIQFAGLKKGGTGSVAIPLSHFGIASPWVNINNLGSVQGSLGGSGLPLPNQPEGNHTAAFTLNSLPDNLATGTYQGDLVVTLTGGSI